MMPPTSIVLNVFTSHVLQMYRLENEAKCKICLDAHTTWGKTSCNGAHTSQITGMDQWPVPVPHHRPPVLTHLRDVPDGGRKETSVNVRQELGGHRSLVQSVDWCQFACITPVAAVVDWLAHLPHLSCTEQHLPGAHRQQGRRFSYGPKDLSVKLILSLLTAAIKQSKTKTHLLLLGRKWSHKHT